MPMKPNKYDERNRWYRKLEKERIEAWQRIRKPEYVPLEKPYAMGWNIYLDINPNCKMDEGRLAILREVVDLLNLKRIYFTRKVDVVKYFRKHKYKFSDVRQYAYEEQIFTHYFDKWDYWRWKSISHKRYENLPEHLKKYFSIYESYRGFGRFEKRAKVDFSAFNYSHNENDYVIVKIKRAYATKRAIPDGEAQSTYRKNTNILSNSGYWGSGGWHWRGDLPKSRKKWKPALRSIVHIKDYNDYWYDVRDSAMSDEEEYNYDSAPGFSYHQVEEEILVKHKIFKHKY